MVITSATNKEIKEIKKLRETKYMSKEKRFLVEGEHLINEANEAGILLRTIILDGYESNVSIDAIYVTKNVMDSISNLPSSTNIIGICKFQDEKEHLGEKVLILDGLQDPGNVGTIIRSSKAFGFDTIVLSTTSVKKYNDKLIRATQGMIFKTNVITKDIPLLIRTLNDDNYDVYGTNVINGIDVKEIVNKSKIAVIMGSEGNGVSKEVNSLIDKNIYINMNSSCESLNVAVAASIIMYELGGK